jgi:hypothetical protein
MAGLVALGFSGDVDPRVADHAARCRALPGGAAVWWSEDQTDEFVGRFQRYRRAAADRDAGRPGG